MPLRSWLAQLSQLLSALIGTIIITTLWSSLKTALHGVILGGGPLAIPTNNDATVWIAVFAMLWLMDYLVTLWHEGGHLLVGWLVGFAFYSFQVGPLKLVRGRDDIHIRWEWRSLAGGAVASFPMSARLVRLRLACMVAAGPLASILFGLLAWRLLVGYLAPCHSEGPPYDTALSILTGNAAPICLIQALVGASALNPFTIVFLFVLMCSAVESGVINLILPYSGKQGTGDGLRLLRLLMGGAAAEREALTMQMAGLQVFGVRPREWPAELVLRRVALAEAQANKHLALYSAYYWALDNGYIERAGEYLNQTQATCPSNIFHAPILPLELAYFEARHRANAATAREWLRMQSTRRARAEAVLRPRAEAAILLLEGQREQAQVKADEALAAIGQAMLRDPTLPETWMQDEEEQLRQIIAEASTPQAFPKASPQL